MNLTKTLRFILRHPINKDNRTKALIRFLKWQAVSRLLPYPVLYPYAMRSHLLVKKGMTGATGNIYCGLHEYEEMTCLLHVLRPGDLFLDIGANIGSYTILAASEVGAEVIAAEPVPATFDNLQRNIRVNDVENKVKAWNVGLGAAAGVLSFTQGNDTTNHVATASDKNVIQVPVKTVDELLPETKATFLLAKIDVEGFETEVLKGMNSTLLLEAFKGIIIELNGSGKRYGYDETAIHNLLLSHGFFPYRYTPEKRLLTIQEDYTRGNTIYFRDLPFITQRLASANVVHIYGKHL
ncbi:MAG TPA: FkbM family methyltransferase [Oligoflexia bacterium]|nr:FkbM family methyltransferase [Oligoflexia bacterium]